MFCRSILGAVAGIAAAFVFVAPAIADDVTFNYQGRVKVQGQPFDGAGQFKFSIMNTSATATLWSNDGSTAGEPASAVSIQVSDGVFSIEIGGSGMSPVESALFGSNSPLKLRTWFSDGVHPFEQLNPDHKLVDLTLNTVQTGFKDFTIYVDGVIGNDANNGLTTQTAKKTIQGAVDILPDRIRCNVTVDIAPGVYREAVEISGISTNARKWLKFIGDKTWSATLNPGSAPTVRVSGRDSDNGGASVVRPSLFTAQQCSGLVVEGIHFEYADSTVNGAVQLENGRYTVARCLVTNAIWGLNAVQAVGEFIECRATNNSQAGLCVTMQSRIKLTNCISTNNNRGLYVSEMCAAQLWGTGQYSNNQVGCAVNGLSSLTSWIPATIQIHNNSVWGLTIGWDAWFEPNGSSTSLSGNATNYLLHKGGHLIN